MQTYSVVRVFDYITKVLIDFLNRDVYKRQIVAIEMNGEPKKFFTNSEEMKNILSQVKAMPDGFPFETTIPVSYTHLDVYKRQASLRSAR